MKFIEVATFSLLLCLVINLAESRRHRSIYEKVRRRIRYGNEVKPHEFPWAALIKHKIMPVHCSGSIIGPKHILTAGHCRMNNNVDVYVGTSSWDYREKPTKFEVEESFLHEDYFLELPEKTDIALIKLKTPITFREANGESRAIKPIALYRGRDQLDGDILYVAGFGGVVWPLSLLSGFKQVTSCDPSFPKNITICTKVFYPYRIEWGDSGSGLVTRSTRGKQAELVGVTSRIDGYEFSVRVSSLVNWIEEKMKL